MQTEHLHILRETLSLLLSFGHPHVLVINAEQVIVVEELFKILM